MDVLITPLVATGAGQVDSVIPLLAILLPLAGAVLVILCNRWPNLREGCTLLAAAGTLGVVVAMLPATLAGREAQITLFDLIPGIAIALRSDPAGMIFALLASVLWLITSVYSIGYMRSLHKLDQTRYYAAFALTIAATLGAALAANLLTFVLFYELITVATYPLVVHDGTPEAVRAGRKYLAYTLFGGLALIAATAWTYMLGLDVTFTPGGSLQTLAGNTGALWGLFILLVIGVGVKAAVMPLHSWLPSAMVAPTPVSALLHAVAVVKAGAFGFVRVIGFIFGVHLLQDIGAWLVLAGFATATLIISSVLAIRMDHLKQRLAYSTISHLSYIVLGVALLGPAAWVGAVLHIVAHGFTKITLFFCAGAIYVRTHKEYVSEMTGVGWQMPLTMTAFTLASLSMIGIPPFIMFASKWFLGTGAVAEGQVFFLFVYLGSGLLAAAYLLPVIFRAFLRRPPNFSDFSEAPPLMVTPLLLTAALTLAWGLAPDIPLHFLELARGVAVSVAGRVP
jgi:formate hydrogenlyase subunit 3/multisubunit Na+/H+ antiporter MnhD subunit